MKDKNKSIYIIVISLLLVITIAFLMLYYISLKYTKKINISNCATSSEYTANIELFDVKDNIITISGYSECKNGMKNFDSYFVLRNNDNLECYKLNTIMKKVDGLVSTSNENCGMFSKSHISFLPKGNYSLLIYNNNNFENIIIETNIKFVLE